MPARSDLLLRDAEALAARVPPHDRATIAAALARSRQKVVAADALWSGSHFAEGLALARAALAAALEAASIAAGASGDPTVDALLARRGLGEAALARIRELSAVLEGASAGDPLPRLDSEVARSHAALYDALQLARRDLDRAVDAAARTPRSVRLARAGRVALASSLVVLALGALGLALRALGS